MTKLEQLHNAMRPFISEVHEEGFEDDIILSGFCPADKVPCGYSPDRDCKACWGRPAEEAGEIDGGRV